VPDAARLRDRYAIAGIGLSRFGKLPGTSAMGFCLEASKHAIDDCGIARDDLDGVLVAFPSSQGEAHGWASRAAAFLGLRPAFCTTMDMGGATAIGMLQTAVALLDAGMCHAVLCAFGTQNSPQGIMPTLFGSPWAIPYGDVGAITFMGHLMRRQMHEHGLTSLDYAHIAVTWRTHATKNPHAQMRKPITIEDHQQSRFINEPMRLFDCCLFTDGGGAFVVTSAERARDLKQTPALVSGVAQEHSSEVIHPYDRGGGIGGSEAAARLFVMAGCTPRDIDVAQLYDAFTPRVVHDLVAYGFCTWSDVGQYIRTGQIGLGGTLPCNTAGGLISEGHLQGMGHVAEAVRQIRGTAYNQVENVTRSMCTGYGGAPHEPPPTVAYSAAILRKP
jgi:acetyl-CoA acetyltransferase